MDRERWSASSQAERQGMVERLELPGFALVGVTDAIATFDHAGDRFALVPGGEVTLGWDPASWQPSEAMLECFDADASDEALVTYVTRVTTRPRTVVVPTLLVEVHAREVGWITLAPDDPDARDACAQMSPGDGQVTIHHAGAQLRARRRDGHVLVERATDATHAEYVAQLGRFRLPTSDEWEHLCGAGARTLFRWGDACPLDHYPIDRPTGAHRAANTFGVHIAFDTYLGELVAEPDQLRGGDGGFTVHAGLSYTTAWLPLATAYFDANFSRRDPAEPLDAGFTIARRVLTV